MDIDYQKLIDESGLELIKKVLLIVRDKGLYGDSHFYISFKTRYPGVVLSSRMKDSYPNEITIILQYQFEDLIIADDTFSVKVSFNGIKETILVPFKAITSFVDPNAKFSLQFQDSHNLDSESNALDENIEKEGADDKMQPSYDNVVQLDRFRNKDKAF